MPDLSPYVSPALLLLGLGLLVSILLRRYYRYFGKRRQDDRPLVRTSRREPDSQQPLIDAPPNALRWQVEMHETARDLKAEIDTKMVALQQLIALAGRQSDRLEAAIARAERLGIRPCRDTLAELERVTAEVATAIASDSVGALGSLPEIPAPAKTANVTSAETRHQIYTLADSGLSIPVIAERTGQSQGDVEIVLSLRKDT
jgi:hypothetical protein